MALPISTSATDNIQTLGDRPKQTDGLTAAQLKIRFDQYAIDNENYNKNILIPGINLISSEKDTNLNSHKTSSDHDGRYFTEAELVNGALDTLYAQLSTTYTKSQVDAIVAGVILGQIGDGSITDDKLSNAVGDIKERLSTSLADMGTQLNLKLTASADIAKFKSGSSSYTDNDTAQTFTDAFCTANSLVTISITSVTPPQGKWTVASANGSFTITSSPAESADITFDYYIMKVV